MQITASLHSSPGSQELSVSTNNLSKSISLPVKNNGKGSAVNGGELLLLALATCFCNDIYREAERRNLHVTKVEVLVSGDFAKEAEAGANLKYTTRVEAPGHSTTEIDELILYVDQVAEIHKTVRNGVAIELSSH